MLIVMEAGATAEDCERVELVIRSLGYDAVQVAGPSRTSICIVGNDGPVEAGAFGGLAGVMEIIPVSKPYKLTSREVHPEDTVVDVSGIAVGGDRPVVIAGPCSVETEARTLGVAEALAGAGVDLFRAGAFKPRTSPYAFQGLGEEGLVTLARVRDEVGLPVVSEVIDAAHVTMVEEYVDVLQVGARNMQNYTLLRRLGRTSRPVLLKRGLAASFDEWLMAAEYLLSEGNPNVILCERGIRTHSGHARNTLDLGVVPHARRLTHLPVVVDPSHGVGERSRVRPMARAALACGAQGLLVEAHTEPETSYSDAQQTVSIATIEGILRDRETLSSLESCEDG